MARKNFREKVRTIEAVQYDGTNSTEMINFAPNNVYLQDGVLMRYTVGPPRPLQPTEWMSLDPFGAYEWMTDSDFAKKYEQVTGP